MNRLENLISELENKIAKYGLLNEAVSAAPVGWHIEHALLTIMVVIDRLKQSHRKEYKWRFNKGRFFVFTFNKIPRGVAEAPDIVKPKEKITGESLRLHTEEAREKLKELQSLHPNNYFTHPYFGKLNLSPAIKFLKIHTMHHIGIINDIIGK